MNGLSPLEINKYFSESRGTDLDNGLIESKNMVTCYKYIATYLAENEESKVFLNHISDEISIRNKFLFDGKLSFADKKMIKHFNFLQNADLKSLMKYRSLICCLDYDFKIKKYPSFCY